MLSECNALDDAAVEADGVASPSVRSTKVVGVRWWGKTVRPL